jgi:ABC-type phosphate transport system permease subunit
MEEKSIFDHPHPSYNNQQQLPNATAVLVLGILSIIICGIGAVLGIIGLVLANKDTKLYNNSPDLYTNGSYSNLKSGKICSIIGLILSTLFIIFYAVVIVFTITASNNYNYR